MPNRINITINSRVYTVVADEETEYLKRLGDYINDKVDIVLSEGQHVMGEKPLVLAALNICDEYFKLLDNSAPADKLSDLLTENKRLEGEIREMKKAEERNIEKESETKDELFLAKKMLNEAEEQIKFLEGQITLKETQIRKQRSEFAIREKELLDMLESK